MTRPSQAYKPETYSVVQHLDHMAQELADSLRWHEKHFQTERERAAYQAGFEQGAGKARVMIGLHGNYHLSTARKV